MNVNVTRIDKPMPSHWKIVHRFSNGYVGELGIRFFTKQNAEDYILKHLSTNGIVTYEIVEEKLYGNDPETA